MEKNKVLLYGAGKNGAMLRRFAEKKSSAYGEVAAYIDADPWKQGHIFMGLPVLSWKDAQKQYGNDFYIYVTGGEQVGPDIIHFLLEQGIPPEKIINYEPVEKRYGCWKSETEFHALADKDGITFGACCRFADNQSGKGSRAEGGCSDPHEATQAETLRVVRQRLLQTAQDIAEGNGGERHHNCSNFRERYYFRDKKIRILHFGGVGPCNIKCSYCQIQYAGSDNDSFVPYSGRPNFSPFPVFGEIFRTLEEEEAIDENTAILLGCGEYSAFKDGERLAELVMNYPTRFLTNAVLYSPATEEALENAGLIICSVDAGTPETFRTVKGADAFDKVSENLREYAKHGPVELKYILLDGVNDSQADLEGFCKLADEAATCVEITRDGFTDIGETYSDRALTFLARYIKYFNSQGKLSVNPERMIRASERERFDRIMREL